LLLIVNLKATEGIKSLLDKALDVIPKEYHSKAQITLKATAGLRMISDRIANQILENVYIFFRFVVIIRANVNLI
jgi:Golgi nucleoside diphosphatase